MRGAPAKHSCIFRTATATALALFFIPAVLSATEISKPTASTDNEGATTNAGNAYDFDVYNDNSSATTTDVRQDPSLTFDSWETKSYSYLDLSLDVTVNSSGFNDDTWAFYYDNTTDTTCDSTDNVLKAAGSENLNSPTNYTDTLPASQDLSQLQVCLTGVKNRGPDRASVGTFDVRTEGTINFPPQVRDSEIYNGTDYAKLENQSDLLRSDKAVFRANVTDTQETAISSAELSLRNSTSYKLKNATMTNISALETEKGARFEYNYSFSSSSDIGEWSYEVFATDTGGEKDAFSKSFDVYVTSYVNLSRSPGEVSVNSSDEFTLSGDLSCWGDRDAECGETQVSLEYRNYTGSNWKKVPEGSGTFVYVGTNTRNCGLLNFSDGCSRSWQVNASGSQDVKLRLNTSSSNSWTPKNRSQKTRLFVDSYKLNLTVEEASGSVYKDSTLTVLSENETVVDSTTLGDQSFLDVPVEERKNSSFELGAPVYDSFIEVEVNDFNLSRDTFRRSQIVRNYTDSTPENVSSLKTVYAFNDTELNISYANITVPKFGNSADLVLHCTNWNYSYGNCSKNSWQVNDISKYPGGENSTHVWFRVEEFDAFGAGQGEPLPNVTEIEIYNVTGLSGAEREQEGTLLDQGLNKTFNVDQFVNPKSYRFSFRIVNEGTRDWSLENQDNLSHSGLNKSWSLGQIWYNVSGTQYIGGTFSTGKVKWDTSQGGTLATGEQMYAKYIVNITTEKSRSYPEDFLVNDSSANSGSTDDHVFNITKYGYLDLQLLDPPSDTVVAQNETFLANSTVTCREGLCGDVNLSVRYNESSVADTLIPEFSGEPFHTNNSNTGDCGDSLKAGEVCFRSWDVNATGTLDSTHLIDANASSDLQIQGNDSADSQVTISEGAVLIEVKWDVLDFGVLNPGKRNKSAKGNSDLKYNITVSKNSIEVDQLWLRAEDLTTDGYGNYSIPAENASYGLKNDIGNETELSNSYKRAATGIAPGTNFTTYYWLDVPEGIKSAKYNGTIHFKANATS